MSDKEIRDFYKEQSRILLKVNLDYRREIRRCKGHAPPEEVSWKTALAAQRGIVNALRCVLSKNQKTSQFQKDFSKGYACACANLIRDHGHSTEVEDCYSANFMSVRQLKSIGADEDDIIVLAPVIKEIERRKNIKTNKN